MLARGPPHTWRTTGATQAPARSAATAPMPNARPKEPRLPPVPNPAEKREKSMVKRSNIARPSTTNNAAMPALNQGEELIVPKLPAVRMTTVPSTP